MKRFLIAIALAICIISPASAYFFGQSGFNLNCSTNNGYVPVWNSTTLQWQCGVNGSGSMVYPGAGVSVSNGAGWNTSLNSTNLATYAGILPSANVQSFLAASNYAAMKAQMGYYTSADLGVNVQAYNASLSSISAGTWTGANSITTLGTIATGSVPWSLVSGKPSIGTAAAWNAGSVTDSLFCTWSNAIGGITCASTGGGMANPMTTVGDLIVGGTSGNPGRLADVATGSVLASGGIGVAPSWASSITLTGLTLSGLSGNGVGIASLSNAGLLGFTTYAPQIYTTVTANNTPYYVPLLGANSTGAQNALVSGALTFNPSSGNMAATSYNGVTLTANGTGFSVAGGTTSKTLTVNNTLTLAGTDATTMTMPTTSKTLLANDLSNLTIASQAQGDVIYFNGTNWVRLPAGTNGYVLQTQGAGANPQWASAGAGSGTVNSGTQYQLAYYATSTTAVSSDATLSDNGTTLAYTGSGGITVSGTVGTLNMTEGTAGSGSAGKDICYADSTAHALNCSFNNGSLVQLLKADLSNESGIETPAHGGTGVANGSNNTITFTGNYTLGVTLSNNTAVTLPTSGTLLASGGALGTPSGGTLTSCVGLPVSTGISGLGTGVATALAVNVGSAGAPVLFNGAGGTPSSLTLTNATGLPVSGITASTSTALGVGSIELGNASDTTIARVSAGVISVEGVTVTRTIGSGTVSLGTSAISSAACATVIQSANVAGIATTDLCDWGFNGDPTGVTGYAASASGMLTIIAYPTSGYCNIKVCNNTSGSITPGAITLNWAVRR